MPGQMGRSGAIGSTLYELAKRPDVREVLEIGTWNGQGSTYCIACGLAETSGRLTSVEVDAEQHAAASAFYDGTGLPVDLVLGLTVRPTDYRPFEHYAPLVAQAGYEREAPGTHLEWYRRERALADDARRAGVLRDLVLGQRRRFDMVLFDGGEFASTQEFDLLEPYIDGWAVFDDTNVRMSIKNAENHERVLASPDWEVVRDEPDDRCGWTVARRVAKAR